MAAVRSQNLAILLTDIAGFTAATARQSREENAAWLQAHAALLKPAFAAFGGTVIKEIGDAFLCTFPSPTDAVLCGTAILDRLWSHNQQAAEAMRLNVRVVVNLGEVRLENGEGFGEPGNVLDAGIAQRALDAADVGGIEPGAFGELLLGELFRLAPVADVQAQRGEDSIAFRHD